MGDVFGSVYNFHPKVELSIQRGRNFRFPISRVGLLATFLFFDLEMSKCVAM
jgi:hypothetical protein